MWIDDHRGSGRRIPGSQQRNRISHTARAEGVFDTNGMFAGLAVLAAGVLLIGAIVNQLKQRLAAMEPHS